jgi:hypothetical protein
MRFWLKLLWVPVGLATTLGSSPASAGASANDPATESSGSATSERSVEQDRSNPHTGQFSLRVGFVAAYRIISRFDTSPYCQNPAPNTEAKKLCGLGAPPALDLAIGFAPLGAVEPFAWGRFGFTGESATNTKPLIALGAGVRLYTLNDSAFKFFIQPAVGWELDKGADNVAFGNQDYKTDLLFQFLAGPQYDFSRRIGAYGAVGITAGVLREIQTWMELDIGIQARLP